jgi:bifunctional non-homologous end joining protein LigD
VAGVEITHPGRPVYSAEGLTKLDLARYLESVSDRMLPHVVDRPLMVLRCPEGVGSPCFIQKRPGPPGRGRGNGAGAEDLVIRDLAGLVGLAQNGAVEIHSWGARRSALEAPDRLVFDLDPHESVTWARVIEVARELRTILERAKLPTFVKSTGGRGLHIMMPLAPRQTWAGVRAAADAVAGELLAGGAGDLTLQMAKDRRRGKIFIDTLRNVRGATCVAPYSPRARDGATISLPLAWKELREGTPPSELTIASWTSSRRRTDPWSEWERVRVKLPAAWTKTPARRR